VKALIHTADENGYQMRVLQAVEEVNKYQKTVAFNKLDRYYKGQLDGKTIAIWGLAFKAETDDMREATSLVTIDLLFKAGCRIRVFDPQAMDECRRRLGTAVYYAEDIYDAAKNADAVMVLTEWMQFRMPDWDALKKIMTRPVVIDGRNLYLSEDMKSMGIDYFSIGR
jgi:UDPglucose 6-dehydrogenase